MKIVVLSDIHGDIARARRALLTQTNAEVVFFTGDGEEQIETLRLEFPEKMFYMVKGNCDWGSSLPVKGTVTLEGKKIFYTHGHMYNAKMTEYELRNAALDAKADILLYGHTHNALTDYKDGLYIMNPGSCHGYGASYGIIEIRTNGILMNIVKLD